MAVKPELSPMLPLNMGAEKSSMEMVMQKLNDMTRLMQNQQAELQSLKKELHNSRKDEKNHLEQLVKKTGQQLHDTLKKESKAKQDQFCNNVGNKLDTVVRAEVKKVLPQVAKYLINLDFAKYIVCFY